jgi:hypothetical protein
MKEFCIYDDMGDFSDGHQSFFLSPSQAEMAIYEDDGVSAAAEDFTTKQLMSHSMACVLGWVGDGDFSYSALDTFIQGIADLDGDGEVQEGGDEENYYNDMFASVAEAMASLGADVDSIGKFIDNEDDDAGAVIGTMLSDKLGALEASDEEIISDYTLGVAVDGQVMESLVKRIRGGVFSFGKKILHRKKQISSLVRAAIKKAGKKAHSAIANMHRKKSMKMRKSRGI